MINLLLPFALVIVIFIGTVKLAAWLCRRARLTWFQALGLVVLDLLGTVVLRIVHLETSDAMTPRWPLMLASLALYLLVGGWFYGRFARSAEGQHLGFQRGLLLSAVHVLLLLVLLVLPTAALFMAMR